MKERKKNKRNEMQIKTKKKTIDVKEKKSVYT